MSAYQLLQHMATLSRAGVPLDQGLRRLVPSLDRDLRPVAEALADDLQGGRALSVAAEDWPGLFSQASIAQLRAAEQSGGLDRILERLAHEGEMEAALRQKLLMRLAYPLILLHAAALIPASVHFVGGEPFRGIMSIILILVPCYTMVMVLWWMDRRRPYSLGYDRFFMGLPLCGTWLRWRARARFSRAMAPLLAAGLRNEEAWESALSAVQSPVLAEGLQPQVEVLAAGGSVAEAYSKSGLGDGDIAGLIQTGESAGVLPEQFEKAHELSVTRLDAATDKIGVVLPGLVYALAVLLMVVQIFRGLAPILSSYRGLLG